MKICERDGCTNEIQSKDKRTRYCSRSCSAVTNNSGRIQNPRNPENYCSICGSRKMKSSTVCRTCLSASRTIRDVLIQNQKASHRYTSVRKYACDTMRASKEEKTCKLCGTHEFDAVIEVCHIKGVTTFSDDTLLSVVNDLSNLIYLCPSHHRLLDKGLIQLE